MLNVDDVETLFNSGTLTQIETTICGVLGCSLYKDNRPLLVGFAKKEIEASQLNIADIKKFIEDSPNVIIEFGKQILGNSKPESLTIGIAISYSIYLIYLQHKSENELLEYLKRRRIPQPQKFLDQLLVIKREMNL